MRTATPIKLWDDQTNPFWLPDDVVHLILQYLYAYQLDRCTLVCRSWRRLAQPMLFDLVTCATYSRLSVLHPSQPWTLYAVLCYCTQVRSLTLSCALAPSFLQHVSLPGFPTLKKLVLTEIPTYKMIVQCFRAIPAELGLEELSLSLASHYTERSLDMPEKPLHLPAIRIFSLFNENESPFATFSLLMDYLFPMLLQLRRLVAHTIHFHSPDIVRLVEANVGSLRYLDSSEVLDPSGVLPCLLNNILREITLCLPVLPNILGRYLSDLGIMFSNLNMDSLAIRHISFVISSTYGLFDLGQHCDLWAQLAGVFSRASYLETVTLLLEVPPWGQSSMFVTMNDMNVHPAFLPLRELGRLRVLHRPSPGHKSTTILPSEFVASL
ncbi:hypothetical protein C8J55DRAFT_602054 [Lentinula edodes]|uniref:F-box domain-containing protein n=1 Tax=Lentinula lateritia TaxID=40482 RepID=A0A9W9E1V3_9AGAR|nr:hypothetical protein C8J55DRAFT_602054 [Lentinula edodes]